MTAKATIAKTLDFDEDGFRFDLVTAQYRLRESTKVGRPRGLLILVNGLETAGKGEAVTQLREWLDPRLLKVKYLETEVPPASEPIWQRHALHLPRHGEITVMFGNWYADLIYAYAKDKISKKALQQAIHHIDEFERDLLANDTYVLKCWFDVFDDTLKARLDDKSKEPEYLYKLDWHDGKEIERVRELKAMLDAATHLPWHEISGANTKQASLDFCGEVLAALDTEPHKRSKAKRPFPMAQIPKKLLSPSNEKIDKHNYHDQLDDHQDKLAKLLRKHHDRNIILVFEGMDAAGKGGAIKRIVSPLDPREYEIHNIAAPEPVELEHPYLWRFWHRLPAGSGLTIFDRSWYGRVLVERVEALTRQSAWQEAYSEINRFEAQLIDKGAIVLKFWLAIDSDVQLKRFKDREKTPHKRFKITPDDWRNRERWDDYVQAAADMIERTSTVDAPWHIVAFNQKHEARLEVLHVLLETLEVQLK